jgi:hypothetical protein
VPSDPENFDDLICLDADLARAAFARIGMLIASVIMVDELTFCAVRSGHRRQGR